MKTSSKTKTKDHLLDIAERHFAIYGFAGTSLRGIIKEAGVNVASVAYHFGTKEELYNAVIERFALPVVQSQLLALESAQQDRPDDLRGILQAFYQPPLEHIKKLGRKGETLALFLGLAQTEPEPIYSLIDTNYAVCRNRFIDALKVAIPDLSDADYQWRFEFMLSLIVAFLTRQKQIRARYGDTQSWNAEEALQRLINFCENGMQC